MGALQICGANLSKGGVLCMLLAFTSVLFIAIALATPHWVVGSQKIGSSVKMGVFNYCTDRCEPYYDDVFNNADSTLNLVAKTDTAAAFLIIALIFTLCAFIMFIFGVGRVGHGETIDRASKFCLVAAIIGIIPMAIFAYIKHALPSNYSLSYSFALATTAWLVNGLTYLFAYVESQDVLYKTSASSARRAAGGMI